MALAGLAVSAAVLAVALLLTSDPHHAANSLLPEPLRPFRPLPIRLINALQASQHVLGQRCH